MTPRPDRGNRLQAPYRHGARRALVTLGAGIFLAPQVLLATANAAGGEHAQWSSEEQQFVYELNRARWDPSAVLAAAGLPNGSVLPSPPLAVDALLADAGGYRSDEMADLDYFAHERPVTGNWPNAVARLFGYNLPSLWPDEANSIESIHRGNPQIGGVLASFVGSSGHRNHLMSQGWYAAHREIGVGARLDERTWTVLTATTGTGELFLTGVAYADANANGRMDLGEGLSGVTITAGTASTTTNAGGGWALAVSPGRYRVTASGDHFSGNAAVAIRVRKFNVEVDFVSIVPAQRASKAIRPQVFSYQMCAGLVPTILGTGGDDILIGGGGNDTLCGGPGRDIISGGPGKDVIVGGPGAGDRCSEGEQSTSCELP